ncbi:transcriptional activator RfaH [Amylibacter sp.]|nr:transcriptional activator RfaH [Amylibacter sp.]MDB2443205.1 transcriptional activator RfaH [Amylibacter sp.]
MSKKWFILQFKPNSHKQAVRNLNQQGFETFLPLDDTASSKKSRFASDTKPLFPGYMFIRIDIENTSWNKINNTYGVSRLITFNSVLKSVPPDFIINLMERCDESGKLIHTKKFKKSDQVKIINGPFINFAAIVEKLDTEQRISALINLMGRKTKIQIHSKIIQLSI